METVKHCDSCDKELEPLENFVVPAPGHEEDPCCLDYVTICEGCFGGPAELD